MTILLAIPTDAAIQTIGTLRFAHVAAVEQYPVMGLEAQFLGDVAHEIALHVVGRLALG